MRRLCATIALVALSSVFATGARAAQTLQLGVSLNPERLGQGTTVGFDFRISSITEPVPSPVTSVDLRYPGDLGVALSGLGLARCSPPVLEALGPEGCPAESRMGSGSVLAEIPVGGEVVTEHATLAVVRAPTRGGHISLLFYAAGISPVDAQIVFPGALLEAEPPFGGLLHIDVPLVPSLPGASDVAVAEIHAKLGPEHLTYYRRVKGKFVAYNPQGILLPKRCPRGGFAFVAELGFLDGTHAHARATVPCPRTAGRRG